MLRASLAALLLAQPAFAQVVSVKTAVPALTGAPAVVLTAPAPGVPGLAVPSLSAGLRPSLAPALAPALAAPAALTPTAVAAVRPAALRPVLAAPSRLVAPAAGLKAAVADFGEKLAGAPSALRRLFDGAASAGDAAGPVSAAASPVRSLESIRELKVGSYNVLNLFEKVGKHVPDPENPGKLKKVSDAKPKEEWSLREQGKVILENDLDVVTLQEVENVAALADFNDEHLGGKYDLFLIEGNDERGIDVAFLVKKDLPFVVEQRSHKEETWVDPVWGGGPTKLFSRDLTSLVVRAEPGSSPLFVLFGTHFKSKRDRDGRDPESRVMRGAQVKRAAEIIGRYRAEFGADTPIMIAGDFNGVVPEEAEFKPLFEAAGLTDAFDASPNPPSDRDRVTHTFHPRGGPTHFGQMDAVLVSEGLRGAVKKAEVYRYKDEQGRVKAIPKTYDEREKNPSDHFPVIVTLDFGPLRDGSVPAWTAAAKPEAKPDEGLEIHAPNALLDLAGPVKEKTLALVAAYLSAERPEREAAYALSTVYYEGFGAVEIMGRKLAPETRRQLETMLAVLDSIVPRAKARRHQEAEVNQVVNTFSGLLHSFDHRRDPKPLPTAPRSPNADARAFADGARAWVESTGAAFDAKIAQWKAWVAAPAEGVNSYTTRNLPAIGARVDALAAAKAAYAREAAAVPKKGPLTPESVRRLYDAWERLRDAAAGSMTIVADSFGADLAARGLIANVDQNSGRHPGGFELFLSPGLSIDWDAARSLNDALRVPKKP